MNEETTAVGTAATVDGGETVETTGDDTTGGQNAAADATPARTPRRRLFPYVLTGVLLLGVAAGATYTGVTVAGADRHSPTVAWEGPASGAAGKDPAADAVRGGRSSTPLSKLLLPVPEGYRPGPDVERYGNDGELAGPDAVALLKQQGKGLAGKERRAYDRRIEKLGIKGIAVRSYASDDDDHVVEVQVLHVKDKRVGNELRGIQRDLAELLDFPKGPAIDGHKNASCFVLPQPKGGDEKRREYALDGMVCSAYESEYWVTVHATGSRSLDRSAVAGLVKQQLDHIKSPGEYV